MSAEGCHHVQHFKKNHVHLDTLKWIHAVFVVSGTARSRKAKICNTYCRTCRKRGPFLHACLECVYFGCHKHIRDHMKHQKHIISIELCYGQIHCTPCNDYVYDAEIDEITMENKMQSKIFRKRLFEWTSWDATEEEKELLHHRTKKICITPESTIGLRGLLNLGKTCFVNCIIQALIHTPLLRDYFLTERHSCSTLGPCLVCEVSKIFQECYGGERIPLVLHELLHIIWIHAVHLAGYKQQDAHEFFIATLNILHKHCLDNMPKNSEMSTAGKCPCIIDQIFTGRLQSVLVCKKCNGISTTIDPSWDFSLDLGPVSIGGRQPSSLHECLERFTSPEHLVLDQKIFCSICQSYEDGTKQFTMKTLPIVVSFHLKRFEHHNEIKKKITTVISFPEMLDMTPFLSRNEEQSPFPSDNRYSLFAVIIHLGTSIDAGHYIAYVRQQRDYWYKCDDHVITRANLKEVLASEGYDKKMLLKTEMDFWRRSAGKSKRDRVRNERIREIMGTKRTIIEDIKTKQLIWYGHVQRLSENRIPEQILSWTPQGKRKRGRPRKSWREGIEKEMEERDIPKDLWMNREERRLGVERRRRTL